MKKKIETEINVSLNLYFVRRIEFENRILYLPIRNVIVTVYDIP